MRRSTALRLLFVAFPLLVGVAVTAAPAPVYKPKPPVVPWVTGWDMPVDPLGDCQFAKAGDKLTITVPGAAERTTAPHMLREIEGDFDVTVRVTGSFRQEGRAAGVVITDGTNDFRFCRASNQNKSLTVMVAVPTSKGILNGVSGGSDGDDPELVFIRIERRKNILTMKYSTDPQKWTAPFEGHLPWDVALPKKLKVGVFAASSAAGEFAPVFDKFELTPVK